MRVTIDELSYITGWNLVDDDEGLPCEVPEDFDHFSYFYAAYKYENGIATLDSAKLPNLESNKRKNEIRFQRGFDCFPYINRGPLWYAKLTEEQTLELNQWYNDWLNAPETETIPERPVWLK